MVQILSAPTAHENAIKRNKEALNNKKVQPKSSKLTRQLEKIDGGVIVNLGGDGVLTWSCSFHLFSLHFRNNTG